MTTTSKQRSRDPTTTTSALSTEIEGTSTVFPASTARANFMDVIARVRHGRERLVITNKGKPAAALVTMEDLRLLQLLDDMDIKEKLHARIRQEEEARDWNAYVEKRRARRAQTEGRS